MATTWDPSFKSAEVTLSGGNLVATTTFGNFGYVRATESHGNNKFYCELEQTIYQNSMDYSSDICFIGASATSGDITEILDFIRVTFQDTIYITRKVAGGSETVLDTVSSSFSDGLIVQFAIDFDNNRFWVGFNNSWVGDPAAGTGYYSTTFSEAFYPYARLSLLGSVITGKFTSTDFSYTPPSGFSEWDAAEGGGVLPDGFYDQSHKMLVTGIDWNSATLRLAWVSSGYTFSSAHTSLTDLGANVVATSGAITPSATNTILGIGNAEFTLPNTTGAYAVLYAVGSYEGVTDPLLVYLAAVSTTTHGTNLRVSAPDLLSIS